MSDMMSFVILLVVFGIAMFVSKFVASIISNAMAPIDRFDSMTYEEKENTVFGLILIDGALAGFFYYFIAYFIILKTDIDFIVSEIIYLPIFKIIK